MNESEFHIRPYSKKELAEFYFPGRSRSATAVTNFRNLMLRNETMMRELREAGYRPRQRIFTSKLIKIIVYHLGEPSVKHYPTGLRNVFPQACGIPVPQAYGTTLHKSTE